MSEWIKEHDYSILIFKEDEVDKYNAAIKALEATKKASGWDRISGVTIERDCRIPSIYHGNDLAIIMERDHGSGQYSITMM